MSLAARQDGIASRLGRYLSFTISYFSFMLHFLQPFLTVTFYIPFSGLGFYCVVGIMLSRLVLDAPFHEFYVFYETCYAGLYILALRVKAGRHFLGLYEYGCR